MADETSFDGTALRRVRLGRGLTVRRAAQGLGVPPETWSRWECGAREPSRGHRSRLNRFMGREVPEISIAGDVLEMRRRGAGLSLAALAARVGVSKAALHRYERGRVPSWAAAEKLREFVEEGEMPTCAPTSSFAQVRAEMAPAAGLGVVRRDAMALSQFLQEGSLLLGAASDRARQLAVDRERLADPQMRRTRVEELRRYAKTTVQGVSGRCTALVQWLDEEWSGGAGQR